MGKITNDRIELTITVNGSAAKNELGKLEKEATSLGRSYKELLLEKKKLNKADADYGKNLSSLNKKITQNKVAVDQNKAAQESLRKSIGLTGLTMSQLNREAAKLRVMKANLTPGTQAFKEIDVQLTAVNRRMGELRNSTRKDGGFGKMTDSFNKFQGIALATAAALTGLGLAIGNILKRNAELSDSLSDVRKTTGFTADEVKRFNKMLSSVDTRSGRKELLELARIAGKLGITGVQDVYGFVKAADQINVALSEDLGGNAEESIRQVGKLVELFDIKSSFGLEQGLLKTGSAINALGAASTANEQYLVNFARRVGGMGALQIANIASEPVPQFFSGKYDVIGQQDGKRYSSSVIDSPATGLVKSPAILVGEKPELIVDPATTRNLMVNYPGVIDAIHKARIPQFASGDYSGIDGFSQNDAQSQIASIMAAQTLTMERLNRNLENGIQAKLLANDEYLRTHHDVDSRYSKLTSKASSSL